MQLSVNQTARPYPNDFIQQKRLPVESRTSFGAFQVLCAWSVVGMTLACVVALVVLLAFEIYTESNILYTGRTRELMQRRLAMPTPAASGDLPLIAATQGSLGSMGDIYATLIVTVFSMTVLNVYWAMHYEGAASLAGAHAILQLAASVMLFADFRFVHLPPSASSSSWRSSAAAIYGMYPAGIWKNSIVMVRKLLSTPSVTVLDIKQSFLIDDQLLFAAGETWVIVTFLFIGYLSLVLVGGSVSPAPKREIQAKVCRTSVIIIGFAVVYWGYLALCNLGWILQRDATLSAIEAGRLQLAQLSASPGRVVSTAWHAGMERQYMRGADGQPIWMLAMDRAAELLGSPDGSITPTEAAGLVSNLTAKVTPAAVLEQYRQSQGTAMEGALMNGLIASDRISMCLLEAAHAESVLAAGAARLPEPAGHWNESSNNFILHNQSSFVSTIQGGVYLSYSSRYVAWVYALGGLTHGAAALVALITFVFTPVIGMDAQQKSALRQYDEMKYEGNTESNGTAWPLRCYFVCLQGIDEYCGAWSPAGQSAQTPQLTTSSAIPSLRNGSSQSAQHEQGIKPPTWGGCIHQVLSAALAACNHPAGCCRCNHTSSVLKKRFLQPRTVLDAIKPRENNSDDGNGSNLDGLFPLVDRSEMFAFAMKLALVLLGLAPVGMATVVTSTPGNTYKACSCAYARLTGIEAVFPCAEELQDVSTPDLFTVEWPRAIKAHAALYVTERTTQLFLRMIILLMIFYLSQTSTSLQRAMQQAFRQKAALQSRLRFLSHECRVPLNSMAIGLDFCQEATKLARQAIQEGACDGLPVSAASSGEDGHADVREAAETLAETMPSLEAAAESMQTTLNDILDMEHIESGRFQIDKRWVRLLPSILTDTRRTFQSQADGMGVDLVLHSGRGLDRMQVMCDAVRLRGALYNFTSNALKWSRPHERLVHRLADAPAASGMSSARPRVLLGASSCPPYLWRKEDWERARLELSVSLCDKLQRVALGGVVGDRSAGGIEQEQSDGPAANSMHDRCEFRVESDGKDDACGTGYSATDTCWHHQQLHAAEVRRQSLAWVEAGLDATETLGMSRSGPESSIHASGEGAGERLGLCLWAFDEGPGIYRQDWGKVFTPFETLHSGVLTAEGQGAGLGLAITASVLKLHGGCVGFSSVYGVGSIFYLWLQCETRPLDGGGKHGSDGEGLQDRFIQEGAGRDGDIGYGGGGAAAAAAGQTSDLQAGDHQANGIGLYITDSRTGVASGAEQDTSNTNDSSISNKKRRVVRKRKVKLGGGTLDGPAAATTTSSTSRAAPALGTEAPAAASPRRTILVVDDSRTNRVFMQRLVRACLGDVRVLAAEDGEDGLRALQILADEVGKGRGEKKGEGLACDLVLLDFSMPRMTGPEMVAAMRGDRRRCIARVPVVGVTGNALAEDQRWFVDCGAQEVLTKPVRKAVIEEVLGRLEKLRGSIRLH